MFLKTTNFLLVLNDAIVGGNIFSFYVPFCPQIKNVHCHRNRKCVVNVIYIPTRALRK